MFSLFLPLRSAKRRGGLKRFEQCSHSLLAGVSVGETAVRTQPIGHSLNPTACVWPEGSPGFPRPGVDVADQAAEDGSVLVLLCLQAEDLGQFLDRCCHGLLCDHGGHAQSLWPYVGANDGSDCDGKQLLGRAEIGQTMTEFFYLRGVRVEDCQALQWS